MLRVQRFPEVLKSVLTDGVEGVVLMTVEGSILSAVNVAGSAAPETVVAAVSSCVFANYTQGNVYDVSVLLLKLDNGIYGITTAGRGVLLVAHGSPQKGLAIGLLRGRLDALSKYFTRIFDQVK